MTANLKGTTTDYYRYLQQIFIHVDLNPSMQVNVHVAIADELK